MEGKGWSGFGYFSPDLEKIKQLGYVLNTRTLERILEMELKAFFSIQSKKKNVR